MDSVSAQRTLVKSPPELWAKLSDADELARHLEEDFGTIRITRLEAEQTVVWEGEAARGTVELTASGWGTKVTLTAEPFGEAPERREAPPAAIAEPQPTVESDAVKSAPEPLRRAGFFARLLGRRTPAQQRRAPQPGGSAPDTSGPRLRPTIPAPPVPTATATERPKSKPDGALSPSSPAVHPPGERAARVLETVLDDLGAAHHRPFSRG